ncbi:aldo/keto reductase [Wenzhouxiangella sp. XN24]|uniref:aldo/keto reductase n=1 Tax=Wenzhouxiangella sp. XN24 TaxID=2713569 RepID=UPI0013EC3F59|nr:aldo/keto reductase [Wenzhouxiangella sp. XN24]NGX16331.1 aldo/keto reductase [Wenzhouxiangella sp. XN24]
MSFQADRRRVLKLISAGMIGVSLGPRSLLAASDSPMTKPIHATGQALPVIGMGTWQTFNVGRDEQLRRARTEVLAAFVEHGGGMVDCSPMYGSSAAVMGFALDQLGRPDSVFSAEKVWTRDDGETRKQILGQAAQWGIDRFDLVQVHNLLAWQAHLETLREMKHAGEIGYIGITTSHGRRHEEFERIMEQQPLDFVQLTYNLTHREVEQRLLPLAQEKGIAVIANRPYDGGPLIKRIQARHRVPAWAAEEFDCRNWADFLLRFIVSHPAVTCAIPATTRVEHMYENMHAGQGPMPSPDLRERMIRHVESL